MMASLAEMSVLMAAAATDGRTVPNPQAQMMQTVGLMVFMVLAMYFLMFRPQQKKAREHAELLKTIKNGDKIVTSAGILGTVIGIKDKSVSIRSADTKLEVLKSSISEITERASSEA